MCCDRTTSWGPILRPTFVALGLMQKPLHPLSVSWASLRLTTLHSWKVSYETRKAQEKVPRTVILASCHPFHDRVDASGGWRKGLSKAVFQLLQEKQMEYFRWDVEHRHGKSKREHQTLTNMRMDTNS